MNAAFYYTILRWHVLEVIAVLHCMHLTDHGVELFKFRCLEYSYLRSYIPFLIYYASLIDINKIGLIGSTFIHSTVKIQS